MSWDQEYEVQHVEDLFEKLTGKTIRQVLHESFERQGLYVQKFEEVKLDDGFYGPVMGTKVTLTDGRVFIPKLTRKFEENGNHGIDYYDYVLEQENPQVQYIGIDLAEEDTDKTISSDGCGNCDACEQGYGCDYPAIEGGCGCGD